MADYRKMYLKLFNDVTDALEELHIGNVIVAGSILKKSQLRCEELFEQTEPKIVIAKEIEFVRKNTKR